MSRLLYGASCHEVHSFNAKSRAGERRNDEEVHRSLAGLSTSGMAQLELVNHAYTLRCFEVCAGEPREHASSQLVKRHCLRASFYWATTCVSQSRATEPSQSSMSLRVRPAGVEPEPAMGPCAVVIATKFDVLFVHWLF